ncbi:WAT1-related protein At3g18200-like [Magnolia sinica]|uniref:WAT1-related protein At3g18200-like n=1 Tax=Magnolia sinica TaxID=86752 RepID=UPI0026596C2E|nr:WAT1-related protein At3g18200-like [Magnolia sinica]XP_058094119.1 WAT1-related protein At3g18200-like [Magnolia sinica]
MLAPSALVGSAERLAPHASMIFVQLSSATYVVVSRVILTQGISSTVFLVYQFALATIFMAALAFIFERKNRPPLTKSILCWIFLLALIGLTLSQNLLSACLYYISSTLEAAVVNLNPVFTFILSIISMQENLGINTWWGKGKIFGTLLSVSGASTLMFWKDSTESLLGTASLTEWVFGLVMVVLGVLALSTWILLLRPMTKRYPAEFSLTAIMFFFGTLQTAVIAVFTSHEATEWKLHWDLELVNIFFGALFYCGLSNLFTTWCAGVKGPIFVASFAPFGLVLTTILEIIFLGDTLYLGSIVGSIMVVLGLYVFLWSKSKEDSCIDTMDPLDKDDCTTALLV